MAECAILLLQENGLSDIVWIGSSSAEVSYEKCSKHHEQVTDESL